MLQVMTKPTAPPLRFWSKVHKTSSCWIWFAGKNQKGYGLFHVSSGKTQAAHRFSWEQLNGPVPKGLELDHLCRVRHCVNPAHLELVTHVENVRRGDAGINMASKTHCPQGHPYDEKNTYVHNNGGRACRKCSNQRMLARTRHNAASEGREVMPRPEHRTHCPQGHEYTEENTLIVCGRRTCKQCNRTKYLRWKAKQS